MRITNIIRQVLDIVDSANDRDDVAPIGAAFPGGDDMHHSKNPADIRTNAPSMYPNFQAKQ